MTDMEHWRENNHRYMEKYMTIQARSLGCRFNLEMFVQSQHKHFYIIQAATRELDRTTSKAKLVEK